MIFILMHKTNYVFGIARLTVFCYNSENIRDKNHISFTNCGRGGILLFRDKKRKSLFIAN